jgi:tetratricopeptide (TPR) repeat protein
MRACQFVGLQPLRNCCYAGIHFSPRLDSTPLARYSFKPRENSAGTSRQKFRSAPNDCVSVGLRNSASRKTLRNPLTQKIARRSSVLAFLMAAIFLGTPGALLAQTQQPPLTNYTGINIEPSQQIFATLCALDAAGFAADESTLAEMPSRLALREDLLKMQGPATEAVRQFYRDHLLADPGETLARYIAFALVAGPPPDFKSKIKRELFPPDVLALDSFQLILPAFYSEAQLQSRWRQIEPEYARIVARYQSPVRRIVTVDNAYLRELLKPTYERSFTVYVEPLVGSHTNFRNIGDHYAIVVGSGSQIPADAIQHAYLHFLLDPLPIRFRDSLKSKSALLNIAARAPRLPVEFQNDFLAFADECLIKAVELRVRHLQSAALEFALVEADQSGFILVRPFVAQLQKFEKAEPAMSYYFPGIIAGLDVAAEQKRLQAVSFAPAVSAPAPQQGNAAEAEQPSELDALLAQGNREIAEQDAAAAAKTFDRVLGKYPDEPRAVYGLAIASVLSGQAARARELFERLVTVPDAADSGAPAAPAVQDPAILAWSHVYLGRIDDLEGERDSALGEYHSALAVNGAPEAARVAAKRGVQQPYSSRARGDDVDANSNSKGPQQP